MLAASERLVWRCFLGHTLARLLSGLDAGLCRHAAVLEPIRVVPRLHDMAVMGHRFGLIGQPLD